MLDGFHQVRFQREDGFALERKTSYRLCNSQHQNFRCRFFIKMQYIKKTKSDLGRFFYVKRDIYDDVCVTLS